MYTIEESEDDVYNENSPERKLIGAIFKQAIVDGDIDFFKSGSFKYYCELCSADPETMLNLLAEARQELHAALSDWE